METMIEAGLVCPMYQMNCYQYKLKYDVICDLKGDNCDNNLTLAAMWRP